MTDLMDVPWVGPQITSSIRGHVPDEARPFGVHEPDQDRIRPRVLVQSFPATKAIVLAGDGISAALPSQIRRELDDGLCALIPFEAPWLTISYGFITRRGRTPSPATRVFKALVRAIEARVGGAIGEPMAAQP